MTTRLSSAPGLARILAPAAIVVLAACASDSLELPSDGAPAHILIVNGDGQAGQAGRALSESLVVSITDDQQRAVVGQPVSFNPSAGGTVAPASVITDDQGKAAFRWVLGQTAGSQRLDVGLGAASNLTPKVTFNATANPGPVHAIAPVSGDKQTGQTGSALLQPLVVKLEDSFGNPVAGENVSWSASDGFVSNSVVQSGADGSASVKWTLGSGTGTQTVTARFQGAVGSPVTFSATAMQGASPRLNVVTQPASSAQSGVILSRQPSVRLEDAQGNPVSRSGVAVTAAIATGGGTLNGTTTVTTNNAGVATFTNLAITGTTGSRKLIFAALGHTAATSATIDLSAVTASPSRSTVSVSPGSVPVGQQATITVTARDNNGQPIAGLQVSVAVSGSGNSVTQPGVTNANGVATGSISSTASGTKSIAASIEGISVNQTASLQVVATTPSGPSAQQSTAHVPGGKVLRWTRITITTRDAAGNRITTGGFASQIRVNITGANTVSNLAITDEGDGTYEAFYLPLLKGTDYVEITIGGVPIKGSPYKTKVR